MRSFLLAAGLAVALSAPAWAQGAAPAALRGVIERVAPDRESLDVEIARLRDLDVPGLHSRWHNAFRRRASSRRLNVSSWAISGWPNS